jgi:hypothetical protein
VDSCQLPVLSGRNRAESIGKNPKIFRPEYCFHKITGITHKMGNLILWQNQFVLKKLNLQKNNLSI